MTTGENCFRWENKSPDNFENIVLDLCRLLECFKTVLLLHKAGLLQPETFGKKISSLIDEPAKFQLQIPAGKIKKT